MKINLTREQANEFSEDWHDKVQLCDPEGKVIRTLDQETSPEFIKEMKRRAASPGPWFTSEQVHAHLVALQLEWDRRGGMNRAEVTMFMKELEKNDPGHYRSERIGR